MLKIYTDGGCRGNNSNEDNIGGWGAYFIYNDKVATINGAERNTTNNKMELKAVIESLKRIKTTDVDVVVYSDSAYVVNGITSWIHGWIKKGWINSQKKPVENKEMWQELHTLTQRFNNIKFEKVKGHSDNEGNNVADSLVNQAMDDLLKIS